MDASITPVIYVIVAGAVGFTLGFLSKRKLGSVITALSLTILLTYLSLSIGIFELRSERLTELVQLIQSSLMNPLGADLYGIGLLLGSINFLIGLAIGVKRSSI
ncbi:MAG: hypothetical protein DRN06_04515 [Thermoprotei archaeon]|mgnify:CR=1 FL=1|nr:MAG: hypothetical protein DRN06_04515 [Thermoprotei archaeon]